jgi:hypothetical protein
MRHAGNFNPEWGYLAPAPSFLRTARVFIVAAAIGAMASAAVIFSLMDRPDAEASVAARTLVQPVEPATPTERSAPIAVQLQTQSERASVSETQHAGAPGAARTQGAALPTHAGAGSPATGESSATSTTQHAPIAAALAESPRIMTAEAPPARAPSNESVASTPTAEAAPAAAPAPAPVVRGPVRRRAVARATPRYDQRYAPRYEAMERGPYAFLRQYGSYGQEY